MMGNNQEDLLLQTQREAREWYLKIHYEDSSPYLDRGFDEWITSSSDHQKAYDDVSTFMESTDNFIKDPLLIKNYKDILPEIKCLITEPAQHFPLMDYPFKNFIYGSIAACLLFLLGLFFTYEFLSPDNIYLTAKGEQQTIVLADGSTVKLNTDTKIEVRFSEKNRILTLDYGQAYFIIAKDPERPFTVIFNNGTVTALGTQFEVYTNGGKATVSLVEGKVKVRTSSKQPLSLRLPITQYVPEEIVMVAKQGATNGAQISLIDEKISPVIGTDIKLLNAWQEKQLIFKDKSLKYVISEINRYSLQKIILENQSMENIVVSGIFPIDSRETVNILKKFYRFTETINKYNEIVLGVSS